jgi:hypothetical protein
MRRAALAIAAWCAGCGAATGSGVALDVTVSPDCVDPSTIDHLSLTVAATPPVTRAGGNSITIPGSIFSDPSGDGRIAVLLPAATTAVDVLLEAFDAGGARLGTGESWLAIAGPGDQSVNLKLGNAQCPQPLPDGSVFDLSGSIDLSPSDLFSPSDLLPPPLDMSAGTDGPTIDASTPPDLLPPPDFAVVPLTVAWRGMIGVAPNLDVVYEGEGETSPLSSGVAVYITGANLSGQAVTVDYGTRGNVFYSSDGKGIATSVNVPFDPATANLGTRMVTFTVGSQTAMVRMAGLDELTVTAGGFHGIATDATPMPRIYSRVTNSGHVQFFTSGGTPGPRGYLYVTGAIVASTTMGTLESQTFAGGHAGCSSALCTVAGSGYGFGFGGLANAGGGGAGAFAMGSAATGGGGGGAAFTGDLSLIGLPGGSGGGSANAGAVAGGDGGGVLRVYAGSITNQTFSASGGNGASATAAGGGAGAGGTVLVTAPNGLSTFTLDVSSGAAGNFGGLHPGGAGSAGLVRLDITGTAPGAQDVEFVGPIIDPAFATAYTTPPTTLPVYCGTGAQFVVEVDGAMQGATQTCQAGLAANIVSAPLTVSGAGLHTVCARVTSASNPTPFYAAPFAEDHYCRAIALSQ